MNHENRTLYRAKPGGKTEAVILKVIADRDAAQKARMKYLKSKGKNVTNLWGSDAGIKALVCKPNAILPGWRVSSELERKYSAPDGGLFIVPDGRQRATYKALKQELRSLPSLPDCWSFTARLGYSGQLRGTTMLLCAFEKVGDVFVVSIPDPAAGGKKFVPGDCAPMKMSEYWKMKEAK